MSLMGIKEIILNYIENKLTDELKDDFIEAAIHFMINEDICTRYDIMRINHRMEKIKSTEVMNIIKVCSVYGYILYRAIESDLIVKKDKVEVSQCILEISNLITEYVTMRLDEKELYKGLRDVENKLNINNDCNEKFRKIIL